MEKLKAYSFPRESSQCYFGYELFTFFNCINLYIELFNLKYNSFTMFP